MKELTGTIFCLAILIHSSISIGEILRLSDPDSETSTYEIFGELPSKPEPAVSLTQIVREADSLDGNAVRILTNVSKVCQRKGCFFIVVEEDIWARIIFKDYSFFLPTDSAGKEVTVEGVLTRRVLSNALAKHYAEDLEVAYSASEYQEEYVITASSVLLMK